MKKIFAEISFGNESFLSMEIEEKKESIELANS